MENRMIAFEIIPMTTEPEMDEKGYVHWKSWQETYTDLMPKEFLETMTLEKCVKMAHKWHQNTLLLKVNGKVAGFCCFRTIEDESEILALYLLKEYHGKKLGYALLTHTIKQYLHNQRIILWVLQGNNRAIKFYKKAGFAFTGNEKVTPFGTELQMVFNS